MTIGVKTAGFHGQDRDFRTLGVEAWGEPEAAWKRIADLDSPGLFAYSDGTRWEVRVSGLDANRRDGYNRPIQNSLIVRGGPDAPEWATLGVKAARSAVSEAGFAELEQRLAAELSADKVESLFTGSATTDALVTLLKTARSEPTDAQAAEERAGSWIVGAATAGARGTAIRRIEALTRGSVGIVAVGLIYPDPQPSPPGRSTARRAGFQSTLVANRDSRAEPGGVPNGWPPKSSDGDSAAGSARADRPPDPRATDPIADRRPSADDLPSSVDYDNRDALSTAAAPEGIDLPLDLRNVKTGAHLTVHVERIGDGLWEGSCDDGGTPCQVRLERIPDKVADGFQQWVGKFPVVGKYLTMPTQSVSDHLEQFRLTVSGQFDLVFVYTSEVSAVVEDWIWSNADDIAHLLRE